MVYRDTLGPLVQASRTSLWKLVGFLKRENFLIYGELILYSNIL